MLFSKVAFSNGLCFPTWQLTRMQSRELNGPWVLIAPQELEVLIAPQELELWIYPSSSCWASSYPWIFVVDDDSWMKSET
jgi:hypothetical protein